ncbi:transcription initiation factor TFIID subunit 7-like [Epargyreus clarus]|uniref:transcription initiation factor TFIID subunit 7-like n=1 Tax=Epargyreus clarus TaxID=520877 RepID=UPI003C2F24BA
MNREKREPEYPVELESQFIMRLPEEPAKALRELLQSGESFKNRLTIQIDPDMRQGEVRFDHWLLYGRIMDLPTIVESLKTIDKKSVYKTADICQIMICKTERDPSVEEESPVKNKKKDPFKVDKKFLWPHGITPPTKNVRKRRFRKTLRKKNTEGPEIEREVKRLLRADNEAVSVTWEVVKEEDEHNSKPDTSTSTPNKSRVKKESKTIKQVKNVNVGSKVEDIFGGALSDSDVEDDNVVVEANNPKLPSYDDQLSDSNSVQGTASYKGNFVPAQFKPDVLESTVKKQKNTQARSVAKQDPPCSSSASYEPFASHSNVNEQRQLELQQVAAELEELKLRRQRTQHEIAGLENMTLRQRFQDILQTLNRDIIVKEKEYKNLQSHINLI